MTQPPTSMGGSISGAGRTVRSSGAAARMRMTRRVARALEPLERAHIEAELESLAFSPGDDSKLRTDLVVQALDLRIRLALLPGVVEADFLLGDEIRQAAMLLLLQHADTAAIVVVLDDGELTSKIYEPFDTPKALVAEELNESGGRNSYGDLRTLFRSYLTQVNPGWDPPAYVAVPNRRLSGDVTESASWAVQQLQSQKKRVPEWARARNS